MSRVLSPLEYALTAERFDYVDSLLNNVTEDNSHTILSAYALELAVAHCHISLAKRMIDLKSPMSKAALKYAITGTHSDLAKSLIEAGCPRDDELLTTAVEHDIDVASHIIQHCCQHTTTLKSLHDALNARKYDIAQDLITRGCETNADTFALAVSRKCLPVVRQLIARKCHMPENVLDTAIRTTCPDIAIELLKIKELMISEYALDGAISFAHAEVIEALLEHPNVKLSARALEAAVLMNNEPVLLKLLAKGCPTSKRAMALANIRFADILLDFDCAFAEVTFVTILRRVCGDGRAHDNIAMAQEKIVQRMISKCKPSEDALVCAIVGRRFDLARAMLARKCTMTKNVFEQAIIRDVDFSRDLAAAGCPISSRALDMVIASNLPDFAVELIHRGCQINAKNLENAIEHGYKALEQALLDRGCQVSARAWNMSERRARANARTNRNANVARQSDAPDNRGDAFLLNIGEIDVSDGESSEDVIPDLSTLMCP